MARFQLLGRQTPAHPVVTQLPLPHDPRGVESSRGVVAACRAVEIAAGLSVQPRIGVISALRGEGRTSVAVGIARVQARDHGRRTLLLELDLLRPTVAQRLKVAPSPGLIHLLDGSAELETCLRRIGDLDVMTAGDHADGLPRILGAAESRLEHVLSGYDVVVIDLPPLSEMAAGAFDSELFSSLLLVIRAGSTPLPVVHQAIKALPSPPSVVLNGVQSAIPRWLRKLVGDWE